VSVISVRAQAPAPRSAARSIVAAVGLVLALALPAVAATPGPTKLLDPTVSPNPASPGASVTLSVTYRNREGSPPDYVRVAVGSATHDMSSANASEDWKSGVRYSITLTLPAGSYAVQFEALDRERFADSISGGTLVVAAPATPTPRATATPSPTPSPAPRPTPTSPPAASPTPAPTAAPTSTATPSRTASPRPGSTATPRPTPRPTPAPSPPASATAATGPATPTPPGSPGASPAPTGAPLTGAGSPRASAEPLPSAIVTGQPVTPSPSGSPAPGAARGGALPPGPDGPTEPGSPADSGGSTDAHILGSGYPLGDSTALEALARALPAMAATTGVITLAMAFGLFGKRRRDEQPTAPDHVLKSAAGAGSGALASSILVPALAMPAEPDAHLPRWRRPSLLEARKADPLRQPSTAVRLTFDGRSADGEPRERRVIRYRLVPLLDAPDELLGNQIGILDEGDEVVPLVKRGAYWQVLCPDGREGWIHKMTLGDVVIDAPSVSGADTWTSGDRGPSLDEVDEDVLRAFLDSRRREELGGI